MHIRDKGFIPAEDYELLAEEIHEHILNTPDDGYIQLRKDILKIIYDVDAELYKMRKE
tara:strand:- start:249 stop:422 length:174 start_codon:yes stop_codon:yes gene_type:complete